jgi:hypothetical protein
MGKARINFRASEEAVLSLKTYMQANKINNMTEALERLLLSAFSSDKEPDSSSSGASDPLFPCAQRMTSNGQHCCMNPPSLKTKFKITPTNREICRACERIRKTSQYNIPLTTPEEEHARIIEPQEPSFMPALQSQTLNQLKSNTADQGAVSVQHTESNETKKTYCPDGGFWITTDKCQRCKAQTYAVYSDCQREKKGEPQSDKATSASKQS